MPLYEYQCDACDARFEIIQKFSDPPPDTCRACGSGPVRRLQSSPAIQFKGTGWYITDYSRKGKPEGSKEGAKEQEGAREGAGAGKEKDAKAPAAADAPAAKSSDSSTTSPTSSTTPPRTP